MSFVQSKIVYKSQLGYREKSCQVRMVMHKLECSVNTYPSPSQVTNPLI